MNCCQCQGIECVFDSTQAAKKLRAYRADGPAKTTRMLLDELKGAGVEGQTLLDIGGGVGAIQHELADAGVSSVTSVEASQGHLGAAQEEAHRRGYAHRVTYHHGDFVDLAPRIEAADIVTLDRVICCYHDVEALVGLSAARARQLYCLVFPRDTWWMKLATAAMNLYYRLGRNPFRTFVHPTRVVDALVRYHGLTQRFYRRTALWQVVVYQRRDARAATRLSHSPAGSRLGSSVNNP